MLSNSSIVFTFALLSTAFASPIPETPTEASEQSTHVNLHTRGVIDSIDDLAQVAKSLAGILGGITDAASVVKEGISDPSTIVAGSSKLFADAKGELTNVESLVSAVADLVSHQ